MNNIFDKFASKMDAAELAASQAEIQSNGNGGNYEEVPVGKYEVKVEKLECKVSSKNNPMISIWFRILQGKYANSLVFYNGVFYEDWMRHRVVKFLSALLDDTKHEAEINLILKSNEVATIHDFCMDIHEAIDGQFEYLLDYGVDKKGYNTYEIEEVYEA